MMTPGSLAVNRGKPPPGAAKFGQKKVVKDFQNAGMDIIGKDIQNKPYVRMCMYIIRTHISYIQISTIISPHFLFI